MKTLMAGMLLFGSLALPAAELGDPAPEIKIAKWVKGEPAQVTGDGTYVVEFWATWCGPCRQSIPHLTEMQKKFKDVTFIGVSDEKEPVVKKFVNEMGDKMEYRVAIDDSKKTGAAYMEAFGINGIPHAFVVKNKKIIWQGHPMDNLEESLEQIRSGKYDLATAKARSNAQRLYEEFREAAFNGEDAKADKLADEILSSSKDVTGIFANDKFDPAAEKKTLKTMRLKNQYLQAVSEGNDSDVEKFGSQLKALDPDLQLGDLRKRAEASGAVRQYFQAVVEGSDKAKTMAPELAGKLEGQPMFANSLAWEILTNEQVKDRDVPLALKLAKRACEDSNWKEAAYLDTYARALFDSGKKSEAVEHEKKAIAALTASEPKAQYEEALKRYEEAVGK